MGTKTKSPEVSGKKKEDPVEEKPKSAFTRFWEKYPNGAGTIHNRRAVLK